MRRNGTYSTSFSLSRQTLDWLAIIAALDGRSATATVERLVMDRALALMQDGEATCRVMTLREGAG